ncbi:uncharacterized protein N7479_009442, partial [Penicillium vulpinum]|uniref:uncharacterized protein n=1 Tax=Penicillium vulpinum TaxID=29845 RepID=UPI0025496A7C
RVNAADIITDQPSRYLHLYFSTGSIQCLYSQHRLKAGEHYLPLIDKYSNERVLSDSEIYLKVRQYRYKANSHFENRWLARLSDNKARRLRGLKSYPSALAIYCDKSSLVGHDRAKILKVNPYTVEILVSSKDRTTVKGLIHSGEVFLNFTVSERTSIWKRLKRTEGIILSLYTFFKDLWYLELYANCIKRLIIPSRLFPTIRGATRFDLTRTPRGTQRNLDIDNYSSILYVTTRSYPKSLRRKVLRRSLILIQQSLDRHRVLLKGLGGNSRRNLDIDIRKPKPNCKIVNSFLSTNSMVIPSKGNEKLLLLYKLSIPRKNNDTAGRSLTPDLPISPLFIPSNSSPAVTFERYTPRETSAEQRQQRRHRLSYTDRYYSKETARIDSEGSRIGEVVEPVSKIEFRFVGSRGIISQNKQGRLYIEPAEADKLEYSEIIKGGYSFGDGKESEDSYAGFRFVPSRPPSPSVGSRYTSTELQSPGEFRLISIASLPLHPDINSYKRQQHPLAARFEDHDSIAPIGKENKILSAETAAQLSLSEEVEKALAILEGRRASEIISGPSRIVGTKSAALREIAKFKLYNRTQRRQQTRNSGAPEERSGSVDQNSEHYRIRNIRSEQEERSSKSVPLDASPEVYIIADTTQKDTLVERPSSSLQRESPAQTDTRTPIEIASYPRNKTSLVSEEKEPAIQPMTIKFRVYNKHGDWNRLVHQIVVDLSDPSPVRRIASKNAREPIEDSTNTIFITFGDDLVVSEEAVNSIARVIEPGSDNNRPIKRRY